MVAKKYRLPDFESCSVALFASLVFMGPLPARSQPPQPARPAVTSPHRASPAAPAAIPHNRWSMAEVQDAFRRADSDGDGELSPQEAAVWPGLARVFDRYDNNKDGSISSAEFDEALK
ncbi:EF-hand domain-containing protein [Ramlibacter sp.]|uniref:EF-hand domain-containing protein n=1 Tax=Ramlibacter sp. TaxID=1917967 RepID=UPI002C17D1D2|nr:EF-hand domain-containing protein [Ramlibacter sp.]HWI83542.1 EF-hand domain-containing protein [Ramlibacter sp.]